MFSIALKQCVSNDWYCVCQDKVVSHLVLSQQLLVLGMRSGARACRPVPRKEVLLQKAAESTLLLLSVCAEAFLSLQGLHGRLGRQVS